MEIEILRFRCPGLEDGGRFPLEFIIHVQPKLFHIRT